MPTDIYTDTVASSEQVCSLMRRINALEQSATSSTAFKRKWGSNGGGDGQFNNPRGVSVSGGEVYVADFFNHRIQVFTTSGTFQRKWGSAGTGDGQFNSPRGVSVSGGEAYVTDALNSRIQVFTTSGTFQRKWGSVGTGDGQFNNPRDVSVSGGEVYVADTGNNRIQVFTTSGTFQRKWGSSGSGDGQFRLPTGIAVSGGEAYVADRENHRIQVFGTGAAVSQTEFFAYTETTRTSLGTPDGGVSVPSLNGLYENNADCIWQHIVDMRNAVETLAPYFTNPATSNPYNWTDGSSDNLYYIAMGDRSAYGATGGPRYTWTRTTSDVIADSFAYGIDIGEIHECVTQLENS